MLTNNQSTNKVINKEGIIYALVFVLYFIVFVLIFIYTINSLSKTINSAMSTPSGSAIETKYGQLDLDNYSLVANKLGLKKESVPAPVVSEVPVATEAVIASTSVEVASSSLPEIAVEPSISVVSSTVATVEQRPTIIINNSTSKSGLATLLKNKLTPLGYDVLSVGNSLPSLATTTIIIKDGISGDSKYLLEIEKIVRESYDFIVSISDNTAKADIEIIIGNK